MQTFKGKIPKKPGVYIFLDKDKKVLYVGRAVNLKNRVSGYFRDSLEPRIKEMVKKSFRLKFKTTDNLLEAIVLEANLIKKYWPKYNIKDRDSRSFIYLVIPKKEFTHPIIVRGKELQKFFIGGKNKAEIFGPYKSISVLNTALRILRRVFPYSTCKKDSLKPCFDYQIGLCPGKCLGIISEKDYQKNIDNLILFLKGKKKLLFKKLARENPEKINSLKHLQDVALISKEDYELKSSFYRIEGYDISYLKENIRYGSMVVFIDGVKSVSDYRIFKIKSAGLRNDLEALEEVLKRRMKHLEWRLPDLIVIDGGRPQIDYIYKLFNSLKIKIPFVGISKYQNDKLVFPKNTKRAIKELIESQKDILLKIRDESHRFAIKFSRRAIKIN